MYVCEIASSVLNINWKPALQPKAYIVPFKPKTSYKQTLEENLKKTIFKNNVNYGRSIFEVSSYWDKIFWKVGWHKFGQM